MYTLLVRYLHYNIRILRLVIFVKHTRGLRSHFTFLAQRGALPLEHSLITKLLLAHFPKSNSKAVFVEIRKRAFLPDSLIVEQVVILVRPTVFELSNKCLTKSGETSANKHFPETNNMGSLL